MLSSLDHPNIPKYISYFEDDETSTRSFYLVQEEVSGMSLNDMISSGMRANDEEVGAINLWL